MMNRAAHLGLERTRFQLQGFNGRPVNFVGELDVTA
jgi:hypothetical protein